MVLVGFLAIFYLMGLFEFGNEPVIDGFSVKSSDKLAELIIPKGALPGNVDPDDVSVTRISSISSEDESWIDYELEPDGLEFTEEIILKVQLDNDDSFPLVLISNGTGIDLVNNTRTEVDLENNTKIVSIPLTHFSKITIGFTGAFGLKISASDTLVGEQVNVTASFTLFKTKIIRDNTARNKGITVLEFLEPNVKYKGYFKNLSNEGVLSPEGKIDGKPSSTLVNLGQTNIVQDDSFKCDNNGTGWLAYFVEVTASLKIVTYSSTEDYMNGIGTLTGPFRNQIMETLDGVKFNCLNPELKIQSLINTYRENEPEFYTTVKIHGPANTTGIVTLTGIGMETMIQPVIIEPSGIATNHFIITFRGEITILAEVGELTAERKFTPKSEW